MLRRFSRDADLIVRLRRVGVDRTTAVTLVEEVCRSLDVPPPEVTFHGGRGPHTGWTRAPLARVEALVGEPAAARMRVGRRPWPVAGMLRFGDPASLGTIAHELGHHLVNVADPVRTPSHGKRWVQRFDEAASAVARALDARGW